MSKKLSIFLLFMMTLATAAQAATRYSVATGNWGSTSTWSASSGGASGASVPVAGDDVVIERGLRVTVNVAAACATILMNATGTQNTILEISGSNTLTVSGDFTFNGTGTNYCDLNFLANGTVNLGAAFTGTLGRLGCGTGTMNFNGGDQTITRAWLYNLVLSGSGTKTMQTGASSKADGSFTISGTASATLVQDFPVGGNLSIGNGATLDTSTYTVNRNTAGGTLTVSSGGTLKIGGTNTIPSNYSTHSIGATSTIEYNGTAQTVSALNSSQTYGNLTLSGSGNKTFSAARTISGTLSISGTAKALLSNGTTSSANAIKLGGAPQVSGSWGSSGSSATNKNDTYFVAANTGIINVTTGCSSAGTWLGTTSTDWNEASNWCGGIPTASTNVTIPSGTTYAPHIGAAGGVCNNMTISSGATLTVDGAYNLTVSGNWTNNGGTFTPGTGTVTFNGTGAQAIGGTEASQTFYNVVVSKTAGQTLSVGGSTTALTVNNLTETTGNFTAPATLTINGNATLTSGTFTAGANTNIAGDWTNNGATFTPGAGTVTFGGTSAQALGGSDPSTFNNLTLNNLNGLTLGAPVTVNNVLTLTSGKIATGASLLILPTTATVSGADAGKYIYGTVQRAFTSGSPSFTFPIGDASLYAPVALSFTGISTPGNITASVTGSDCTKIAGSLIDSTRSVNHCWTLANDTTVFTSYAATFSYGSGSDVDVGAVPANFIVQNYSGGSWTTLTDSGTPSGTSATVSGVSAFGDFAIGDCKPPSLTVITSANPNPNAAPGEVITYTVQVTNSGAGPAMNVEVTNQLSRHVAWSLNAYGAGVPFSLSQGTPASGLTLGTPVYSDDNGSTWTYTPVSGAGGAPAGYDNNVTNWKIPMSGTMNASGAIFTFISRRV